MKSISPAGEVLCHCSGTKRGYIQNLFEQGMDIAAISRWTGALSGCGGCEWDIADFLKVLAEQRDVRPGTSLD
ncbi:MAG: (2Fe-2S)-binding protein [Gammaproteobacteria bacterium]|nr:(2Fe-2S)-binding protein [Gammaproteobacteria bacterium]MBU1446865.1 (2Fe-2S)-binding protein [Gammaproteobacteria bacterium]MDD2928829.1 (2Fe-2S)-binding protein [Sideroxydans sp.]MDD5470997.1 (2Fe-2S)-binding protein [Sideroxydans sp.]